MKVWKKIENIFIDYFTKGLFYVKKNNNKIINNKNNK